MKLSIRSGDRNQCPTCHQYFNSTRAFDKHRVGDHGRRRCMTTEEMLAKKMRLNAAGFWVGQLNKRFEEKKDDAYAIDR